MERIKTFKQMPLYQDIINNKQMHSIMLISKDECQLDEYANLICLSMFCEGEDKPCGKCSYCQKILHNNCVDILKYPKKDTVIKSDELTEIVDSILELPYEANIKIYVLSNMSNMDRLMQNKLLKSLEEPPANVFFILKVNNESQILQTVKSRCRKIYLPSLKEADLKQTFDASKSNVLEAISFCDGSQSQAQNFIENVNFVDNVKIVFDMLLNFRKSSQTLFYANKLYGKKDEFLDILNIFLKVLQDVNYINIGMQNLVYSDTHMDELLRINSEFSVDSIIGMVNNALDIVEKIDRNCNYNALIDGFLLGILEVRHKCPM